MKHFKTFLLEQEKYYWHLPFEEFLVENVSLPPVFEPEKFSWATFKKQINEALSEIKNISKEEIINKAREYSKQYYKNKLLTPPTGNVKLKKGYEKSNIYTIGLFLAPSTTSGIDICPCSTDECRALCLGKVAGRNVFKNVQESQKNKTKFMFQYPKEFIYKLVSEIYFYRDIAEKEGKILTVRLNGTSDIPWETISKSLFEMFPDIQFYDYTKIAKRTEKELPLNYHLTLSYTGPNEKSNWRECKNFLDRGGNVAVVFNVKRNAPLPKYVIDSKTNKRYEVIDGDKDDNRFLNEPGQIIGLRFKTKTQKLDPEFIKSFTIEVPEGAEQVEI